VAQQIQLNSNFVFYVIKKFQIQINRSNQKKEELEKKIKDLEEKK
jgi:hypothetical protein